HQAMDVVGMFKPVTKWATSVINPHNIPEIVRKAFKLAETEKPGACHIELPEDIAAMDVSGEAPLPIRKIRRPVCDSKVFNQGLELIRSAKRPIILAGNGAIRKRASKQLRLFAETNGISVINTFMGKGAVDRNAPECLFTAGLQSRDHVSCAIDRADLVIAIGYDLVEYHPRLWNDGGNKKIVHIDFLPAETDKDYAPELEIIGDIAHTLWMLNERTDEEPLGFDLAVNAGYREEMQKDFDEYKDDTTEGSIRPQKVLSDVRAVLGEADILLSDVGAHKMWIARYYQCNDPNTCLISNGFCSMGFALPGAMAAQMVNPGKKVMAICGDAGFLMNVQDMETIRRLELPVVCMIWEDHQYGLIAWKQQNHFGKHTDLAFTNPEFVKLAESFGWEGYRVNNAADLKPTLEKAYESKVPALIVLPIDYRENDLLTKRLGSIPCSI
ncbi:MAG: acetolactate synthase large subunit, partial [Halobacteriovoraceae bacterium]|nr:acetolactate synthase large subunit [Halobacteriovoraceae bacterium]